MRCGGITNQRTSSSFLVPAPKKKSDLVLSNPAKRKRRAPNAGELSSPPYGKEPLPVHVEGLQGGDAPRLGLERACSKFRVRVITGRCAAAAGGQQGLPTQQRRQQKTFLWCNGEGNSRRARDVVDD